MNPRTISAGVLLCAVLILVACSPVRVLPQPAVKTSQIVTPHIVVPGELPYLVYLGTGSFAEVNVFQEGNNYALPLKRSDFAPKIIAVLSAGRQFWVNGLINADSESVRDFKTYDEAYAHAHDEVFRLFSTGVYSYVVGTEVLPDKSSRELLFDGR